MTAPAFALLLGWRIGSIGAFAAVLALGGLGLSIVSTFLSALVARASQKSVLFVVISFPLLAPLLLPAIAATVAASNGRGPLDGAARARRLRRRRGVRRVSARLGRVG